MKKRGIFIAIMLFLVMLSVFSGCSEKQHFVPGELRFPDRMEIRFYYPGDELGEVIEPYSTIVLPHSGYVNPPDIMFYDGDDIFHAPFTLYSKYDPEEYEENYNAYYLREHYERGWPRDVGYYEVLIGYAGSDFYYSGMVAITVIIEE